MAITFNPTTKQIVLDSVTADMADVWSRWEDWYAASSNAVYLPALTHIGGDDLGGGLYVANYFFLENGWQIRPMDADHSLTITGNLSVAGGGSPIAANGYAVVVKFVVPVQAQGIATSGSSGPTAGEIASAVKDLLMAVQLPVNIMAANGSPVAGTGAADNKIRFTPP